MPPLATVGSYPFPTLGFDQVRLLDWFYMDVTFFTCHFLLILQSILVCFIQRNKTVTLITVLY
jgi:hypothetical protein